jgi:hypothetical protein
VALEATTAPPRIRRPVSGRALASPRPERMLEFIEKAEAAVAEPTRTTVQAGGRWTNTGLRLRAAS